MIDAGFRLRVATIPGSDGWWKSSTAEVFEEAAERLWKLGMPEAEAVAFLSRLYDAVADEHGS